MNTVDGSVLSRNNASDGAFEFDFGLGKFRKKIVAYFLILTMVLFSTSCANMPKATSMSVGGVVAGAAAGSRYGLTGMLVGAAVGGFIGNQIGSYLDEEDKKKLAELELQSLSTGKPSSFVASKSGATVTVTPQAPKVEVVQTYSLPANAQSHQLKIIVPQEANALIDTPLFSDLNENSTMLRLVKKGDVMHIPAHVETDSNWGVVVAENTVVGYLPLRYLDQKILKLVAAVKSKPIKAKPKLIVAKKATPKEKLPVSSSKEVVQAPLENLTQKNQVASTLKVSDSGLRVVRAVGVCKEIIRSIDTGDSSEKITEKRKFCQEPPPAWKPVTV